MAYYSRSNYQYFTGTTTTTTVTTTTTTDFEFDESDVWNTSTSPQTTILTSSKRKPSKKQSTVKGGTASSLPVNVPDWSKILKQDYRENRFYDDDDECEFEGFEGGACRVPPHEFLAKQMAASFSVHEGIGRTLKGRDLSRVRNAIWEKTGFQD